MKPVRQPLNLHSFPLARGNANSIPWQGGSDTNRELLLLLKNEQQFT